MDYFTKTIVIHQVETGFSLPNKPLSAICRFEREDGIFRCYLSISNLILKDSGKFYLCVVDRNNQSYFFEVDNVNSMLFTFPTIPDLENDFACGIYYENSNIPLLIAFTKTENGIPLTDFKKLLYDKYIKNAINLKYKENVKEETSSISEEKTEKIETLEEIKKLYDDEAVATENYYEDDLDLKKKIEFIESFENEFNGNENEQTSFGKQEAEKESDNDAETYQNERNDDGIKEYSESNPFYLTVEKEMQDVLTKFPKETTLMNIIPNSNFVKVNYAENKYYAVGLIYENKKERYICYGVPDKYSKNPPKELKGYCQFIPLSMFTPFGDGYWMMFQDATFGTCVKMK
ncbi:MAG: hypothetical protein KBS91_00720, partial [Firmicutes bacterium]|nr:hypothetical protein [Candidatus Caballimonas caccae]